MGRNEPVKRNGLKTYANSMFLLVRIKNEKFIVLCML